MLTGTVVAASVLLIPGGSWAADGTAPAATAGTVESARTAGDARAAGDATTARLATGERLELLDGGPASGPDVQVVPAQGKPLGRYAYTSTDGSLRVRPVDQRQPVAATEIATGDRSARTLNATKAAAVTKAAAATYPVKLTITNADVTSKMFWVWDRKTWAAYDVTDAAGASASVNLPPGDYFAVGLHSDWEQPSYLLTKTFTVAAKSLTVSFDQSAAKETAIKVDDTTASRYSSAVWISLPGGDLAGFAGSGSGAVYVTPFSVPGTALRIHDVLAKKGTSASVPSPYRYDLTHAFQNTVPASPVAQVRTASLAKTVTSVRAPGNGTLGELLSVPNLGEWTGVYLGSSVPVPGTVTEYATPGVSYSRILHYGTYDHSLTLKDRTLAAGTSAGETLGAAPFAPSPRDGGGSSRQSTKMWLYEPMAFTDSDGNPGIDDRSKTSFLLTSQGQTLASGADMTPYQQLSATVPSGRATYELDQTVSRRVPYARLSTQVRSEWTFSSSSQSGSGELPLIDLDFATSGLDARNTAGAGPVRIGATAATRNSEAADTLTGLEYSTDDGAHWTALPLSGSGESASAELTVPSSVSFVSLRATAVNDQGGSLRRTITRAFAGATPRGDETAGATKISNVLVNGGKPVVFDTAGSQVIPAQFTATDPAGIAGGDLYLYHRSYTTPDGVLISPWPAACTKVNATTSACRTDFVVDVRRDLGLSGLAGEWKVAAWAQSADGRSFTDLHAVQNASILRFAKLTVNASPEPVTKGKTITVTGKLTRSSWQASAYDGYASQSVKLQFRKANSTTYTTVKTIKTDASSNLKTTVTASVDGYWRYSFAGTATTSPVTTAGDYVDVK
ncbi:hypothetical protein ACFWNG_00005 [Streptomyces sp. NPDC058391]|uniref:hypothetical protein n=1 Tax=Streptomyces sp. NPDC058391 TaxID=3346476 RepID=UPI003660A0B0